MLSDLREVGQTKEGLMPSGRKFLLHEELHIKDKMLITAHRRLLP